MRRFAALAIVIVCTAVGCGTEQTGALATRTTQTRSAAQTSPTTPASTRFARSLVSAYEADTPTIMRDDYRGGVWHPHSTSWRVGLEMGDVAAILARETGSGRYRQAAIKTFDVAIARHVLPDGGFDYDVGMGPPATPSQISTGAMLVSLGTAYLELGRDLSPADRARWAAVLRRAAEWLTHDTHYYVNGNINLQGTLGLYLAWRATRDAALYDAYRSAWRFTLAPGSKWPGRGLIYTTRPTNPLATDGAGYLTEQGQGSPGFDPHYTILQADYAAELFAVSRSRAALRLLDLLVNQLFTRIDRKTLTIRFGGGSRHTAASGSGPFISASLPTLAFSLRKDLLRYVPEQERLAEGAFRYWAKVGNDQDQIMGNYAMTLLALRPVRSLPAQVPGG